MVSVFENRHIGTADSVTGDDRAHVMMSALPPALADHVGDNRLTSVLPEPASEGQVLAELEALADQNAKVTSLIGLGYYGTFMPSVLRRCILENPSWYTAYTPYQPEISQGRLEALVNFQTVITDLTGMDIANASLLDEATAVAEAMLLARRATKGRRRVFVVDADILPQSLAVLETRAEAVGIEIVTMPFASAESIELPADTFGVVTQYPGASGRLWNPAPVVDAAHSVGAIAIAAADILALTLITPPAALGFDVVVGSTQRFGVPMGFGGPHAAFMGVKQRYERQLPGRLVGVSHDVDGRPAYRLALQTREQHIRRERATSNICTAQVLLAVLASMYAVYHGPKGLRAIAEQVHAHTVQLASSLRKGGVEVRHDAYFDTLQIAVENADAVVAAARQADLLIWKVDDTTIQLSIDETTTPQTLSTVATLFGVVMEDIGAAVAVPEELRRPVDYLQHPVFNEHHSETSMMRYLKRLADKDYALDRGMIPLGSCTMKLNAATEMLPITWDRFANVHPFAPHDDVQGYLSLINDLETWLAAITGYDAVSVQPNAGSQGELSGLLAIRRYHRAHGDDARTVCLIPSSAHGTNAASAVLAGLTVAVVACDDDGNVDLEDLGRNIERAGDKLAALMITYPSTHGVFEPGIRQVCDMVHAAGGQVYIDGANLNALVGWSRFGDLGGDVSHLNLHKTFAIPHGGGGPGIGPIAAKAHLAPYLPGHPFAQQGSTTNPVAAAPFGSASVLPISWAYIKLMGGDGLRDASAAAVYAANYVSRGLADVIPTLYTEQGYVAHECILDLRSLTTETGVSVDDVAKRLIDYGFHAPTMSFPVIGTLMVEPTESEDLAELDRFIAAMRSIVAEARAVASGTWPVDDNPLVNAPHTARHLTESWEHPYDRETAVFPQGASHSDGKYWPPVRRIDNAWGDRHLVCTCPEPSAFV